MTLCYMLFFRSWSRKREHFVHANQLLLPFIDFCHFLNDFSLECWEACASHEVQWHQSEYAGNTRHVCCSVFTVVMWISKSSYIMYVLQLNGKTIQCLKLSYLYWFTNCLCNLSIQQIVCKVQAQVARMLDNAMHWINHYSADSLVCFVTLIHWIAIYSVDNVIQPSNNWDQAPVVQRLDNAIHRINHYPAVKC